MTREEAKEKNLDLFHFPTVEARTAFAEGLLTACGRESFPFEETVAGFVLIALAVGRRPDEGKIAASMKEHHAE